jgi:hypothetical protein
VLNSLPVLLMQAGNAIPPFLGGGPTFSSHFFSQVTTPILGGGLHTSPALPLTTPRFDPRLRCALTTGAFVFLFPLDRFSCIYTNVPADFPPSSVEVTCRILDLDPPEQPKPSPAGSLPWLRIMYYPRF